MNAYIIITTEQIPMPEDRSMLARNSGTGHYILTAEGTYAELQGVARDLSTLATANDDFKTDRAGRLAQIHDLLSTLDLNTPLAAEGTAWGSTIRAALALAAEDI